MKTIHRTALALLAAGFVSTPVMAYVLPLDALIDQVRLIRQEEATDGKIAEGRVELYDGLGQAKVLAARRSMLGDGRCRIDVQGGDFADFDSAHVFWDGAKGGGSGQPELQPLLLLERLACPLSARGSHAVARIEEQLRRLGVERAYTGYSRIDGRVAYVIGARSWETERPQLWLDKDSLVPTRVIGRLDGMAVDLRVLGPVDDETGEWRPRKIQLFLDGRLAVAFVTERLDRGVQFPGSLFR